jgi:DNA-binding response OmpR family regulator
VLVVDDAWATRRALAQALAHELGAEVDEAEDGEDARYALMEGTPDVAVVDANTPWTDGPELVRRMRADPATVRVPIVGMSALPVSGVMLDAGCDAFVTKPFVIDDLIAVVRRVIRGDGDAPA